MVPRLPAELTDHIIDYLHDDFDSLAACALTCRQWLPAARFHTLGEIVIWPDTCTVFVELLAVSPELALVVRSVELRSLVNISRVWQLVDMSFLGALTAVADLKLSTMRVADATHEALVHALPAVQRVTVNNCWFATLRDFAAMVSSFRRLEYLSMSFLIGEPNATAIRPLPPLPTSLYTMELGDLDWDRMPAIALLGWLKHVPEPQQIVNLSCHVVWESWPTQVMLENFGSYLHHLELVVKTEVSLNNIFGRSAFSVEGCTSLRTFTLRMWLAEMCVLENQDLPWIPKLLSQLRSPRLHQITLALHTEDMADLRTLASENAVRQLFKANYCELTALDWDSVCGTLAGEDFAALRRFVIEGRGPSGVLEAHILREHPELHRRSVLVLA